MQLEKLSENIFYTYLPLEFGFFLPQNKSLFISESWIRGAAHNDKFEDFSEDQKNKNSKTNSETFLAAQFSDFIDGDLVVHVQHGIARFRGLMTISLMDITGDFIVLEYANQDKIYIPVHKLNLIQKYIGAHGDVQLDALKNNQWENNDN